MSLRLLFVINRDLVEEVIVVRVGEFKGANRTHRYEVIYDTILIGYVDHRYSDNVLTLAQKALTLVNESLP